MHVFIALLSASKVLLEDGLTFDPRLRDEDPGVRRNPKISLSYTLRCAVNHDIPYSTCEPLRHQVNEE